MAGKSPNKKADGVPIGERGNQMFPKRWQKFLQLIANGTTVDNALKELKVSRQTYEAYLIANDGAHDQYKEAEIAWIRRDWPMEKLERIAMDIAMNMRVKDACEKHGITVYLLARIRLADPLVAETFREARRIAAEMMSDEILEIADEVELDGVNTTANSAKVNHARLKVTARQWLMSKWHSDQYGDRIKQDVETKIQVDHASELDNARKRKDRAHKKKKQLQKQKEERVMH